MGGSECGILLEKEQESVDNDDDIEHVKKTSTTL